MIMMDRDASFIINRKYAVAERQGGEGERRGMWHDRFVKLRFLKKCARAEAAAHFRKEGRETSVQPQEFTSSLVSSERFSQAISTWEVQSEVRGKSELKANQTRQRVPEALWRIFTGAPLPRSSHALVRVVRGRVVGDCASILNESELA